MKFSSEHRAYWEGHIRGWERSDLTQQDYCVQESLAYGSFKRWRVSLKKSIRVKNPSFIEATLAKDEKASLVLQVSLVNGSRIGLSSHASRELVEQVLSLAGQPQ